MLAVAVRRVAACCSNATSASRSYAVAAAATQPARPVHATTAYAAVHGSGASPAPTTTTKPATTSYAAPNRSTSQAPATAQHPFAREDATADALYASQGVLDIAPDARAVLSSPVAVADIDITPDGMLYLPVTKYRQILNTAFGAGSWALVPRGAPSTLGRVLSREYALVVHGRFVAQARGEQMFFNDEGIPTATEGARSSALSRCCKDLGIASELWDRSFATTFKREHAALVAVMQNNVKRMLWRRKDRKFEFPIREV